MGILAFRKARRRKEQEYYTITGLSFIVLFMIVLALLNQPLLALIVLIIGGIFSAVMLPKMWHLSMQEIEATQKTDVSAPLTIKRFFAWDGMVKLKHVYGVNKTMLLYSLLTTGAVTVIMLAFNILGILTPVIAFGYVVLACIVSIIYFNYVIKKVIK